VKANPRYDRQGCHVEKIVINNDCYRCDPVVIVGILLVNYVLSTNLVCGSHVFKAFGIKLLHRVFKLLLILIHTIFSELLPEYTYTILFVLIVTETAQSTIDVVFYNFLSVLWLIKVLPGFVSLALISFTWVVRDDNLISCLMGSNFWIKAIMEDSAVKSLIIIVLSHWLFHLELHVVSNENQKQHNY